MTTCRETEVGLIRCFIQSPLESLLRIHGDAVRRCSRSRVGWCGVRNGRDRLAAGRDQREECDRAQDVGHGVGAIWARPSGLWLLGYRR